MTYKQDNKLKFNTYNVFYLEDKIIDLIFFINDKKQDAFKYVVNHYWNVIFFLILIVPIFFSIYYEYELPGIYYFYMIIMLVKYIIDIARKIDDIRYESEEYDNFSITQDNNYIKNHKKIYNSIDYQKEKNGGLTDLEVKNRKKEIWNKLLYK